MVKLKKKTPDPPVFWKVHFGPTLGELFVKRYNGIIFPTLTDGMKYLKMVLDSSWSTVPDKDNECIRGMDCTYGEEVADRISIVPVVLWQSTEKDDHEISRLEKEIKEANLSIIKLYDDQAKKRKIIERKMRESTESALQSLKKQKLHEG